jgi:isopentenyldiphosphate isomerase
MCHGKEFVKNIYQKPHCKGSFMEELVRNMTEGESKELARAIGIFVINSKGDMLLHKKTQANNPEQFLWEIPYLIHTSTTHSPLDEAQRYLVQLGIESELHEAFTINSSLVAPFKGGHVIIALAVDPSLITVYAHDIYQWAPIDYVIHDAHEHSGRYAPWFKAALEGVALYLKNLLQQRSARDRSRVVSESS